MDRKRLLMFLLQLKSLELKEMLLTGIKFKKKKLKMPQSMILLPPDVQLGGSSRQLQELAHGAGDEA